MFHHPDGQSGVFIDSKKPERSASRPNAPTNRLLWPRLKGYLHVKLIPARTTSALTLLELSNSLRDLERPCVPLPNPVAHPDGLGEATNVKSKYINSNPGQN